MNKILMVALIISVTGCATSSQTYAPSGKIAHTINCSGKFRSWNACIVKAGDICTTSGYDVLHSTEEEVYNNSSSASGAGMYYRMNKSEGNTKIRTMTIACK